MPIGREDPEVYRRDVKQDATRYPIAGAMAANIWPCFAWPFEPAEPPVKLAPTGAGRYLLVQGLRDPATPYDGAVAMRAVLGSRSRLVTVDIGGHVVTSRQRRESVRRRRGDGIPRHRRTARRGRVLRRGAAPQPTTLTASPRDRPAAYGYAEWAGTKARDR